MPLLIHATQKLLAELPATLIDHDAAGESWHANLLRIDRRKCVLITHDATLYSVFVPVLRKPDFAQLDQVLGQQLFKALLWEGFPQALIERMLDACRAVRFTRSSNRSVLGSMNDPRFQIEVAAAHVGGLAQVDQPIPPPRPQIKQGFNWPGIKVSIGRNLLLQSAACLIKR